MLQSWTSIQQATAKTKPQPANSQQETPEQREHRLRSAYESALSQYRAGALDAAHHAFTALVAELSSDEASPFSPSSSSSSISSAQPINTNRRHAKRPRTSASAPTPVNNNITINNSTSNTVPIPEWQRRLRYVTLRNLAETCAERGQHDHALEAFARALEDDSSDLVVWLGAARAASAIGHLHIARRAYECALSLRPDHWLVRRPYRALLAAIGDGDDDVVASSTSSHISKMAADLATCRATAVRQMRERRTIQPPETLRLTELSWSTVVDALRLCLNRRLSGKSDLLVAHPIRFVTPPIPVPAPILVPAKTHIVQDDSNSSEEVVVVSDSRPLKRKRKNTDNDNVETITDDTAIPVIHKMGVASDARSMAINHAIPSRNNVPETSTASNALQERISKKADATTSTAAVKTAAKKPEIRRSARRANAAAAAAAEAERRTTRTTAELMHNQREDTDMIQALLQICYGDNYNKYKTAVNAPIQSDGTTTSVVGSAAKTPESPGLEGQQLNEAEPTRMSLWKRIIDEREEAMAVGRCIELFETTDGGPIEMLLRVLDEISRFNVAQYFSTLALLWLTLHERLELSKPGSSDISVLIVEALVVSGKKASKQKARRFQEANRLLSHIYVPEVNLNDDKNHESIVYNNEKNVKLEAKRALLCMRIAWVSGILHDCRGEMQLSFQAAERTLKLARFVRKLGISELSKLVPESAGPDLSGYTWDGLGTIVQRRIAQLKSARDLEKAQEELKRSGAGDTEAAKRTISILAPSVRASIRALSLERWNANDFKVEFSSAAELDAFETRLESEIDLEPRLKLLSDACVRADDIVGELICFAVRLRMAVHYYAAKVRCENQPNGQDKDTSHGDSSDSSAVRMADLLIQIRRFVMLVKKVSSHSYARLWSTTAGPSGWSMAQAAVIVASTIITLTELIITMIPFAKHSSTATELGAAQKNRRLGFTRCMLAFPRCVLLAHKCLQSSGVSTTNATPTTPSRTDSGYGSAKNGPEITKKMLYVTSFCLRALEARGCCREEGTSGALIKMYAKFLNARLEEIASRVHANKGKDKSIASKKIMENRILSPTQKLSGKLTSNVQDANSSHTNNENDRNINDDVNDDNDKSSDSNSSLSSANYDGVADPNYDWWDARVIRHELAQCFECLHQIPELETVSGDTTVLDEVRWLENACRVSKHIGLAFIGGDGAGNASLMDPDVCRNIYFFYRKRIFEAVCLRRRDGGRVKRLREVLSRLAEALPEDAPKGVPMLSFQALDTIVSDVVDSAGDIAAEAADSSPKLEEEWNKAMVAAASRNSTEATEDSANAAGDDGTTGGASVDGVASSGNNGNVGRKPSVREVQLSIMYFEVFSLHAMSILDAYETEYKKQKNAERRKRPKEVADKLLSASSECLIALRCRPWSIGAWILLGRIFVEISDLALDERELCFSSFGLYNTDDIASLGDGESVQTIFGRAEACFGFAESLARHKWARDAAMKRVPIEVSSVLGFAYDGNDDEMWYGFGDDMDLFGTLGLSNETTSRLILKNEPHPVTRSKSGTGTTQHDKPNDRQLAAIRLGSAALVMLRLRELRYFHMHWTQCSLDTKVLTHPVNQFPSRIVEMAGQALHLLREGLRLYDGKSVDTSAKQEDCLEQNGDTQNSESDTTCRRTDDEPAWRTGYCALARTRWYYTLMEAKLLRKCGRSYLEYLPVFKRALEENTLLRASQKIACDIEPLYKLHASRMKVLRTLSNDGDAMSVLTALERFSYDKQKPMVVDVDDVTDEEDWVTVRRNAVAEDILSAMQACCENRPGSAYTEFFFKATFCRAILLSEMLNDTRAASTELAKLFRVDAAVRVLDGGLDGVHRGYFYRMWNYRYTDTGMETAVESERKLIRWRAKLLGLYGAILHQGGEWRLLAAIIIRLRKRISDDLPVDGAVVDDLIGAYATCRRASLLSSMERGIVTDAAVFEASFRTTWHIYTESLRLSHAARRVRLAVMREEQGGAGEERLVQSGRPRCLVTVHAALRIEHIRWKAAVDGVMVDIQKLRDLPYSGRMADVSDENKRLFVESVKASSQKWPVDEKLNKMLTRRLSDLGGIDGGILTTGSSVIV